MVKILKKKIPFEIYSCINVLYESINESVDQATGKIIVFVIVFLLFFLLLIIYSYFLLKPYYR